MDPAATLRDAESHLRDGELSEAAESLAHYRAWRQAGGFEPPDGDRRAHELERHLAKLRHDRGRPAAGGEANDGGPVSIAQALVEAMADLERRLQEKGNSSGE
jgi:hypothetical protein